MQLAVIGAGAWGTTLANLLAGKGYKVSLWIRETELFRDMQDKRENSWFLPGIRLQADLELSNELGEVVSGQQYILMVVPSQYFAAVLQNMTDYLQSGATLICASKGIEVSSLRTMSRVVEDELEGLSPRYAILSGPSFAHEVSKGLPAAVSLGCADAKTGKMLQEIISCDNFRVYYNQDYLGVELGGALKNVMAIATGICDGLNFGNNSRAALITRGLAEMSRLGEAMGASRETFMGLSGMGDLVLTCTGALSRNRQVGLKLGQGEKLPQIMDNMQMVAEGVKTTESVYMLSKTLGVEMPISKQVYAMLYQEKDVQTAVQELLARSLKEE